MIPCSRHPGLETTILAQTALGRRRATSPAAPPSDCGTPPGPLSVAMHQHRCAQRALGVSPGGSALAARAMAPCYLAR